MSSFPPYRRRVYGPRCASPPTFVCYELPQPDSYSRSSSPTTSSDHEDSGDDCDYSESESHSNSDATTSSSADVVVVERMPDMSNVDPKDIPCPPSGSEDDEEEKLRAEKREGKKKEVAEDTANSVVVEEDAEKRKRRKKRTKRSRRDYAPEIRPILTIRSSQGFVWNQDLFVPPYIKERYIATTPPSSYPSRHTSSPKGKNGLVNNNFFSTSNEADYEVECVEIRVDEAEMDSIIPRY